jgi:hypothetical protein
MGEFEEVLNDGHYEPSFTNMQLDHPRQHSSGRHILKTPKKADIPELIAARKHEIFLSNVLAIIQTCPWQETSLSRLQAIPARGTSILESHDPAMAWTESTRGILRQIDLVRTNDRILTRPIT